MNSETIKVKISALRLEAEGVLSLELIAEGGGTLPPWSAGAHIDLHLPSGLVRQYSLCSDPANLAHYRTAVRLNAGGRGGSREIHHSLRPGGQLAISIPRNHFALQSAARYLLVAGGIGITPLLPMLRTLQQQSAEWTLLYAGRSRQHMAFIQELQATGGARVELLPSAEGKRLNLCSIEAAAENGSAVYSCGPASLLDELSARFAQAGLGERLHLERFSAPASAPASGETEEGSFRVILQSSGRQIEVRAGCSILSALREAGIEAPCSCEQGICGTCETRVLDGIPDHRDQLLTARERESNQSMMLCVSRALSETLTLDL